MMRDTLMLFAVLLIAILLVGSTFMSGLGDFGDKLADFVKYGFEDIDDLIDDNGDDDDEVPSDDSEGQLCVGITVQFKDGTQHTIGPEAVVFTLFPMTVYFENKEVEFIWWHCNLLVDWTGDIETFAVTGPMQVESGEVLLIYQGMSYDSSDIPKNEWFEIWKFALEAVDIEYMLGGGEHSLDAEATVNAEVTFTDGNRESKEATATSSILVYSTWEPVDPQEGRLTVFNAQIQPELLLPH